MDLSKLPKLSGNPPPPQGGPPPALSPGSFDSAPPFAHAASQPAQPAEVSAGAVWISLIIGVIFVFLGMNFARWLLATAAGRPFVTGVSWTSGENAGKPVEYWDLSGGTAWTECGMFLFGFAALLDVAVMLAMAKARSAATQRVYAFIGAAATAVATLFNLIVCVKLFSLGILPLFSLLAVAVGGYLLLDHYVALLRPRQQRA